MKLHLSLLLCVLALGISAQTKFQKTAGSTANDRNYHLAAAPDGSLYATGYTEAIAGNLKDVFLVKYNPFGEVQWAKTYGDVGDEVNWDVIVTQNNQLVGVGYSSGLSPFQAGVITRSDTAGNLIWARGVGSALGHVNFYRVIETSTGFLVATGLTTINNQEDVVICKFTATGTLLWSRIIKTLQDDEMMGLIETADGHYLMAGLTNDAGGNGGSEFAVAKVDTMGQVIWKKRYGGTGGDRLNAVVEHNHAYYFLGWGTNVGIGNNDAIVMKTDTAGNIQWINAYGTLQAERAFNLLYHPESNSLIVAGYTDYSDSVTNNRNTFLMSLDLTGQMNWAKSYGSTGTDGHWPTGLAMNSDQGFYVLASTNTFGPGSYSLYLTKTDVHGNSACHQKNPQFSSQVITGWSGVNFATDSTMALTAINILVTGMPWSITSSTQCCALFADGGPDREMCDGETVQIGLSELLGYQYAWTHNGTPAGTGPFHMVPSLLAGHWVITASAAGSGCSAVTDSVYVISHPVPLKPGLSVTGLNTLTSTSAYGNQWYLNGVIIAGAIDKDYDVLQTGSYHVVVTDSNGCVSVPSDPLYHVYIGLDKSGNQMVVSVSPNPAQNHLTLTFGAATGMVHLRCLSADGRLQFRREFAAVTVGDRVTLDVSDLAPGVYRMQILSELGSHVVPVLIVR